MEANQPSGSNDTLPTYEAVDRSLGRLDDLRVGDVERDDTETQRNSFLLDTITAVARHGGYVFLLWAGIPPSPFFQLHNKRLPGRFRLSGENILMLLTLSFGIMATVFAVVVQNSPSAGLGIAVAGFVAILLFLLKENQENFPDFAPWFFEREHQTDSLVAVLLVALIGIGRLPLAIYIYAVHPEVTKFDPQAKTSLYALGFEVSTGNFILPLGIFYELTGGRTHGDEEDSFIWRLLLEEMCVVYPRFLLLVITRRKPILAAKVFKAFSFIAIYFVFQLCLIMYQSRDDKVGAERSDGHKDGSGEGKVTASPASPVIDEKDIPMGFD